MARTVSVGWGIGFSVGLPVGSAVGYQSEEGKTKESEPAENKNSIAK
jgi:hypothetical protein